MKPKHIETPADEARHRRSHSLAVLIVRDAELRGVFLEDIVSHSLSKLKIRKLERILLLARKILDSKYSTRTRYEENNLFEFEVSNTN